MRGMHDLRSGNQRTARFQAGKLTIVPKAPSELARGLVATGAAARSGNALTRRAGGHELVAGRGGAAAGALPRRVVVDIREFMSPLPAVLYSRGMDVVPVTLEVGDFVLSPDLCVERKAVPDLIQSLDSGRLYTQAVSMCRHYATPVLLIEFDPGRSFALQSAGDLGLDIRSSNVSSKLVILLLNFPKIRCAPTHLLGAARAVAKDVLFLVLCWETADQSGSTKSYRYGAV